MKRLFVFMFFFSSAGYLHAQAPSFDTEYDSAALAAFLDSMAVFYDSVEATIEYRTGKITIPGGIADLTIPTGFKYVADEQARYVMSELYGNPEDPSMIGILMPESMGITYGEGYIFVLYYQQIGYVKDDDAQEIDFEKLLDQMRNDASEENRQRIASGLETYGIVGWAKKPYYDSNKKVLNWAKELKFESDTEINTLNYNILILGRKGILTMNAISTMNELPLVEDQKENIIRMFSFHEGYRYEDFDPETDEVAAWTIGGLVAGKILTEESSSGIAKYIGLLLAAIGIAGIVLWRWRAVKNKHAAFNAADANDQ